MFEIISSSEDSNSPTSLSKQSRDQILFNFALLRKGGMAFDFKICVDSETFNVNKWVLAARCSYFENMFSHNCIENRENVVKINDFSHEVIHAMIEYIYTAELPKRLPQRFHSGFLAACDKYNLPLMKNLCEKLCMREIRHANAITFLRTAELHSATKLKDTVISYICSNYHGIFGNEEQMNFVKEFRVIQTHRKNCRSEHPEYRRNREPIDWETWTDEAIEKLIDDYGKFLDKDPSIKHYDLTLMVEGKPIYVHRCLLGAHSTVFKNMMKNATNNCIVITDHSFSVVKEMIKHLYTGKTSDLSHICDKLLIASNEYDLNILKEVCATKCLIKINETNVFEFLRIANSTESLCLKVGASDFIRDQWEKLGESEQWRRFNTPENRKLCVYVLNHLTSPSKRFKLNPPE